MNRDIIPTGVAAASVKVKLGCFWSHLKFFQLLKHGNTTTDCFRVAEVHLSNRPNFSLDTKGHELMYEEENCHGPLKRNFNF